MDPTIIQGIAGIYWFFNPQRVTEGRIALIFGITEDEVQSIKESSAYFDAVENLMRTTRSPEDFVKWIEIETLSEISEQLGKRMGIDPNLIRDMIERITPSKTDQDLDKVPTIDDIIDQIKSKSANGDYIYRGESKNHLTISSSLYREYLKYIDTEIESFSLTHAQGEMLKIAKNHIGESPVGPLEDFLDIARANRRRMGHPIGYPEHVATENIGKTIAETADRELLTELQHYGGKTNLIDFTTDYLIALYFACSDHPKRTGRVILLEKNEEVEDMMVHPRNPRHRILAQKSVFLQPPEGYIKVPEKNKVYILADQKKTLLEYLRKFHDISTESIYNDIHGFIRYQRIHQNAYVQFYTALTFQVKGDRNKAIEYYTEAINLNPSFAEAYHNRGWCRIYLKEWKKAATDLEIAEDLGADIVDIFRDHHGNVENFEKKANITLPKNIARMLGESVDDISPNEKWTVERFYELLSSQEHSGFNEFQSKTERLSEFGVDLMNLVEKNQWELTPKIMRYYFALYFQRPNRSPRRVFGVNLSGHPRLAVWLPEDVLRKGYYHLYGAQYTYTYRDFRGLFPEHIMVADIKDLLEFAYNWHAGHL